MTSDLGSLSLFGRPGQEASKSPEAVEKPRRFTTKDDFRKVTTAEKLAYKDIVTDPNKEVLELGAGEQFEDWRAFDPLQIKIEDGIKFMIVRNPLAEQVVTPPGAEKKLERRFEELRSRSVTPLALRGIARETGILKAKWMIFFEDEDDFVHAWQTLGKAFVRGEASSDLLYMKTEAQVEDTPHTGCKINVFVRDYTDQDLVVRSCEEIYVKAQVFGRLACKPDVYSVIKLMSKNPFKIRPTVASCDGGSEVVYWDENGRRSAHRRGSVGRARHW